MSYIHIPQLDGNVSLDTLSLNQSFCNSCENSFESEINISQHTTYDHDVEQTWKKSFQNNIPVIITTRFGTFEDPPAWFEQYIPRKLDKKESKMNRITVRRDHRLSLGESLPTIYVSNVRSLGPKLNSFKIDMKEREIGVSLLSEVWQKTECKKQQYEVEKMFQIDGLKYISTPRTQKRGGGAAIVANLEQFSLDKIDVIIPFKLEVVWGLLRPKKKTSKWKEIIVGSFYSPPNSKKNSKLLDHLMSTVHFLLSKYPNAGVILGGDKNSLNIAPLLSGIPKFKQIVTTPTYKAKILDVIMTNLHQAYSVPVVVPPVLPDDPARGAPSDHSIVIATPHTVHTVQQPRQYVTRTFRPLPDSGMREFGQWICSEGWGDISDTDTPTEQVQKFEKIINQKLETFLPLKTVKINPNFDKPYITGDLKKLDRKIKREYRKNCKSKKYLELKSVYDEKLKKEAKAYLDKNVRSLMEDDPGKAYQTLKKMGAQPGDCLEDNTFHLLSHLEDNLSQEESVEKIAQHFARISQEYPPLNPDTLPEKVKIKLNSPVSTDALPDISDPDVYSTIRRSKKPRSSVPGDLPRRIIKEFAPELAPPAAKIFRQITRTGTWPKQWRTEYGTPLQKISNPVDEDDLRIISLTNYFSKQYEHFVILWLLKYVGSQLDCAQYGGVKGSSISHYLINFINFILYNQDLAVPQAVVAVMVDFSKAFNRINHNTIITILSEMGVPGWLLRIVIGFLTDRELILRHKGGSSGRKSMPGGGPQGTKLGLFLFLILINAVGYPNLEKNLGQKITEKIGRRSPIPNIHMKYVDDLSLAQSINLKQCVVPNPNPTHPLNFHERTNHILPPSTYTLQDDLNKLADFSKNHQMVINTNKCKVMMFHTGRKVDALPQLTIPGMGGDNLEVVESFKLLGVKLRSDLRWVENTDYICKRGYNRLWMLRRLKALGATEKELVDVYEKQVRSLLELAVPVWHPALTQQESGQIERVQKSAFHIILGKEYESYENAQKKLGQIKLSLRRKKLCQKFARKCLKSQKFSNWFCPEYIGPIKTRLKEKKRTNHLKFVPTRTNRYENSPLPYMTKLLNQ